MRGRDWKSLGDAMWPFASELRGNQESGVLMFAFRKVTLETV